MSAHNWVSKAACRGQDLLLFFGADGERYAEREVREATAKRICHECPVRRVCLEDAMERNDKAGVFGGQTAAQRAYARRGWLSRKRRAAA